MAVQSIELLAKHFIPASKNMPERRYDLDWLRILVFGLLILYHIGMLYVENWGFHFKNVYQSQTLENFMIIVEPWLIIIGMIIYSLVRVLGVLMVLALAYKYLNRKSALLGYFNDAVYPFILCIKQLLLCWPTT